MAAASRNPPPAANNSTRNRVTNFEIRSLRVKRIVVPFAPLSETGSDRLKCQWPHRLMPLWMPEMARILMTGFEGFLGRDKNPSWDGIAAMTSQPSFAPLLGSEVAVERIPVQYGDAERALADAITRHGVPNAILMFGMHGGPDSGGRGLRTFYIETVAHNADDSKAPDNRGEIRIAKPIVGDVGYNDPVEATLPVDWLSNGLSDASAEWAVSQDAGRYLCNHLMFCALRLARLYSPAPLVAFVHVPPSEEMREGALPNEQFPVAYAAMARAILVGLGDRSGVGRSIVQQV